MANLTKLPIQMIITMLDVNPDSATFPMSGGDISRAELEAEVSARPLPPSVNSGRATAISGIAPITVASRKRK